MLVQCILICSLILHVLLKDGESTMNRGFTNDSKTAFKEGRLTRYEQRDSFLQSANALVVSQQYYKGRQLRLCAIYHCNDSLGCMWYIVDTIKVQWNQHYARVDAWVIWELISHSLSQTQSDAKENHCWYILINAKQLCKQLFLAIPYYNCYRLKLL